MLRRPPTVITLTSDDINAYEENRQKRLEEQQTMENKRVARTNSNTAVEEKRRTKARSAQERIMGASGSTS